MHLVEDMVKLLLPASLLRGLEPRFKQAEKKLNNLAQTNPAANWLHKVAMVPPTQPLLAPRIEPETLAEVQECLLANEQVEVNYLDVGADSASTLQLNPLGLDS